MAANYPQTLDTDTNLILVTGTDGLIPAHHNNTKDAVEAIEMAVGVMDNTLGGRVGASFASPLMHQAGVRSLHARNPYQPHGTPAITDLYAVKGALPAGSTLDTGVTTDFTADAPYLKLHGPAGASLTYLHIPLAAGATDVIGRMQPRLGQGGNLNFGLGFKRTGHTGITGIMPSANGSVALMLDGASVATDSDWFMSVPAPWVSFQVFYDGTDYLVGLSSDGILWHWEPSISGGSVAPAEVLVVPLQATAMAGDLWIDFVQQGIGQIGA